MSRDDGQVWLAVDRFLCDRALDDVGLARAAIARTLASKLDQVRESDAAQAAVAVPAIAKELREVLDAVREASDDSVEYVAGLFTEVGDSAVG